MIERCGWYAEMTKEFHNDPDYWAEALKLDFAEEPALPALGRDGQQVIINVDLPGRRVYAMAHGVVCVRRTFPRPVRHPAADG